MNTRQYKELERLDKIYHFTDDIDNVLKYHPQANLKKLIISLAKYIGKGYREVEDHFIFVNLYQFTKLSVIYFLILATEEERTTFYMVYGRELKTEIDITMRKVTKPNTLLGKIIKRVKRCISI